MNTRIAFYPTLRYPIRPHPTLTHSIQVLPGRASLISLVEATGLGATGAPRPVEGGLDASGSSMFVREPLPLVLTALFIVVGTGVALCTSDLGIAVALTGATGAVMVSVLVPAGSYVLLHPQPRLGIRRVLAAAMFVAGIVIMIISLSLILI